MKIREFLKNVNPLKCKASHWILDGQPACPLAHGAFNHGFKPTAKTDLAMSQEIIDFIKNGFIDRNLMEVFMKDYDFRMMFFVGNRTAFETALQTAERSENFHAAIEESMRYCENSRISPEG